MRLRSIAFAEGTAGHLEHLPNIGLPLKYEKEYLPDQNGIGGMYLSRTVGGGQIENEYYV
jgi:hypothetical protein